MESRTLTEKTDLSFVQTGYSVLSSDYEALDGIWREFIAGVISFLKANELPDNKMVG